VINSIRQEGGKINIWGVGTKLVTAYDQPALDGVYKLSALDDESGQRRYRIKLSEQSFKVSTPGILQVRRYFLDRENIADAIYQDGTDLSGGSTIVDPVDDSRRKKISDDARYEDLLIPIFRKGECVYKSPDIQTIREFAAKNLGLFSKGVRRFVNAHQYPAGIEKSLFDLKHKLIEETKRLNE
jgi:nicotinate phosphoribosyltransferase